MTVTVTQQDRDAAAQCYLELEGPPYSSRDLAEAEAHRAGEYDASAAVQAFARHREQARADAWQPIETAPKDGAWIWAYYPVRAFQDRQQVAQWVSDTHGESRWVDVADHFDWTQPTHWMPLPPAPDAIEQGAHRHDA